MKHYLCGKNSKIVIMEEKDYLGFDLDEELSNLEITDEDIAFLLKGMKPSDITEKTDDEQLNKISDFYKGKFVCLDFKEFDCRTFGKCHGVKIVDEKFVFLFMRVVDAYDYNLECDWSKEGEFIEVEAPYDIYTYFYVSEMYDDIVIDDMDDVKRMLELMVIGNVREYFWWMMAAYAEDCKINPDRYEKNGNKFRLKDEKDDIIYDKIYSNKDVEFDYGSFGPTEYERVDITKNEMKDICDFYKGQFVIMTLNGQPHLGRISHMDIKPNSHNVKLFFDALIVTDESDGVWTNVVGKDSLKFDLGTDFNNWFFDRTVCSSEDIVNLMCNYLTQLHRNEICLGLIGEECGISFDSSALYAAALEK